MVFFLFTTNANNVLPNEHHGRGVVLIRAVCECVWVCIMVGIRIYCNEWKNCRLQIKRSPPSRSLSAFSLIVVVGGGGILTNTVLDTTRKTTRLLLLSLATAKVPWNFTFFSLNLWICPFAFSLCPPCSFPSFYWVVYAADVDVVSAPIWQIGWNFNNLPSHVCVCVHACLNIVHFLLAPYCHHQGASLGEGLHQGCCYCLFYWLGRIKFNFMIIAHVDWWQ